MNADRRDTPRSSLTARLPPLLGALLFALGASGCVIIGRPPTPQELGLEPDAGHRKAVVLVRVLTEIDGRPSPAFPSAVREDDLWLGLGDFSSGGKIRDAPLRFFSRDTRKNGWAYLLLEPGIYYLAPHPPQNGDAFSYLASWGRTPPSWHFEVPRGAPVIYIGTLFVPGTGQWMIGGGRRLRRFDPGRFEIRDETVLAEQIRESWLKDLTPLTSHLGVPHSAGEPIILETPPGK